MQARPRLPSVSLVLAARDEEDAIGACMSSILAMDYPDLELIAIDDMSGDGTHGVMDKYSRIDERVKVLRVEGLPDGWLGKPHALHLGSKEAKGEYILFTDGDVVFEKEALSRAAGYAVEKGLDLLCLVPEILRGGSLETALKGFFTLSYLLGTRPWAMSRGRPGSFFRGYGGVGAFNLVRRASYERAGGHSAIRFDVLDDLKLGKLMMRSGCRQEMLFSDGLVRTGWNVGLSGLARGLEKNAFAAAGYSLLALAAGSAAIALSVFAPYAGIVFSSPPGAPGYALAALSMHAALWLVLERLGRAGIWASLLLPVAGALYIWAFWRSALVTIRQGGVRWRGRFYPLSGLKENMYR